MMKDVRRADGWVVALQVGADVNTVTHTRWDQSLAPEGSPDHFEVQWEARVSFDAAVTKLTAVIVRVRQVVCDPYMPTDTKATLMQLLRGDGYIV